MTRIAPAVPATRPRTAVTAANRVAGPSRVDSARLAAGRGRQAEQRSEGADLRAEQAVHVGRSPQVLGERGEDDVERRGPVERPAGPGEHQVASGSPVAGPGLEQGRLADPGVADDLCDPGAALTDSAADEGVEMGGLAGASDQVVGVGPGARAGSSPRRIAVLSASVSGDGSVPSWSASVSRSAAYAASASPGRPAAACARIRVRTACSSSGSASASAAARSSASSQNPASRNAAAATRRARWTSRTAAAWSAIAQGASVRGSGTGPRTRPRPTRAAETAPAISRAACRLSVSATTAPSSSTSNQSARTR